MSLELFYIAGLLVLVGAVLVWTIAKLRSSPKQSWVEQLESQRNLRVKDTIDRSVE